MPPWVMAMARAKAKAKERLEENALILATISLCCYVQSKGRGKGDKAGKGMKGQVMRVMTAAHCDLAAEGDSQK